MKIFLGTTSKDKKNILTEYLKDYNLQNFVIQECDVGSEVDSQPLDELSVLMGANNRAVNALKSSNSNGLGIGLEGGLTQIAGDDNYYLVCAAVIKNSLNYSFVGVSSKLSLPRDISNLIKKGEDFGVIIKEEAAKFDDLYGYYEELVSRKLSFRQAIHNAFYCI